MEPQRFGSHMPDRIMDFPQWKKASRTRTIIARSGTFSFTAISASSSGSLASDAVPLTRTTSRRFGTMKMIATVGFSRTLRNVSAVVSEPVGYRKRMPVENLHKTWGVAFGRDIHCPGGIDARNDDKWGPLNPRSAVRIYMVDHLGNLIWKNWPNDRLHFSGARNRLLGLIHGRPPQD